MNPLLSVLMTSYNRELYIAEAIESVLASTYTNFELIIVDDGSKDNTVAIAKTYEAKDSRIHVYINEKNLGDYPNRNKAASYAKGEYLIWVDSDDTLIPDALSSWVENMQSKKVLFAIFMEADFRQPTFMTSSQVLKHHFFIKSVLSFGPGATMIDRTLFLTLNGFPTKYGPANDMYQNLKIGSQTSVLLMPWPLSNYRRHEGQEINNGYAYLYNNYRYLNDALLELNMPFTKNQQNYLRQKNKRRFVVNWLRYLLQTLSIRKAFAAIKLAGFKWNDWIAGLFAFQSKPLE